MVPADPVENRSPSLGGPPLRLPSHGGTLGEERTRCFASLALPAALGLLGLERSFLEVLPLPSFRRQTLEDPVPGQLLRAPAPKLRPCQSNVLENFEKFCGKKVFELRT